MEKIKILLEVGIITTNNSNNLQGFHYPQIENAPSIHNYNRDYLNWSYGGNNIEK